MAITWKNKCTVSHFGINGSCTASKLYMTFPKPEWSSNFMATYLEIQLTKKMLINLGCDRGAAPVRTTSCNNKMGACKCHDASATLVRSLKKTKRFLPWLGLKSMYKHQRGQYYQGNGPYNLQPNR